MKKIISSKHLMKYLLCILTGILLNGCYSGRLVSDYNPKEIDTSRIAKIDFKDGTTVDFDELSNKNQFIKIENGEITYKNQAGATIRFPESEICRLYYSEFNLWKTAAFTVAMGLALTLTILKIFRL